MAIKNIIWKLPKIIKHDDKRVTILELFFDLVIVSSLGGLVDQLVDSFKDANIDPLKLVFAVVWPFLLMSIWRGFTIYSSNYENDSFRHTFLSLSIIGFLALTSISMFLNYFGVESPKIKTMISIFYTAGICGAMFVMFYLNITASLNTKNIYEKKSLRIQSLGYIFMILGTLIGNIIYSFSDDLWAFILLQLFIIMGLFLHIACEIFSKGRKIIINLPRSYSNHLQERLSVLFVIFMGEFFIQVIKSVAESIHHNELNIGINIAKTIFVILIIFNFWYIFNQLFFFTNIYTEPKRLQLFSFIIILHFISFIFIIAGAVISIHEFDDEFVSAVPRYKYVLFAGMLAWAISIALSYSSILPINKNKSFIWPKMFSKLFWLLPFILMGTSFWIFIPKVSDSAYIYYLFGFLQMISLLLIFMLIQGMKNSKNREEEFKNFVKKNKNKATEYAYKNIDKCLIDWNIHIEENWDLNIFSSFLKDNYKK